MESGLEDENYMNDRAGNPEPVYWAVRKIAIHEWVGTHDAVCPKICVGYFSKAESGENMKTHKVSISFNVRIGDKFAMDSVWR